jgi:hypothetical protein
LLSKIKKYASTAPVHANNCACILEITPQQQPVALVENTFCSRVADHACRADFHTETSETNQPTNQATNPSVSACTQWVHPVRKQGRRHDSSSCKHASVSVLSRCALSDVQDTNAPPAQGWQVSVHIGSYATSAVLVEHLQVTAVPENAML